MAKAVAVCMCKTCGSEFEKVAYKHSRREADEFEEWAKDNCDECPACYRKRKEEEARAKAAAYPLPEITSGTERQVSYAESLRTRYVAEYEDTVKYVLKCMKTVKLEKFRAAAAERGMDPDAELAKKVARPQYKSAYVCLTETDAGKIIDCLR